MFKKFLRTIKKKKTKNNYTLHLINLDPPPKVQQTINKLNPAMYKKIIHHD